jgi:predicted nuclease with TOPRIM domain
MTDIVERLPELLRTLGLVVTKQAANEIESLRQQLDDATHAYDVCRQECERITDNMNANAEHAIALQLQLAECQEENHHLKVAYQCVNSQLAESRANLKAALDEAIKQAKREALFEAASWLDEQLLYEGHGDQLRRMAENYE